MPTNRTRRSRRRTSAKMEPGILELLMDEPLPPAANRWLKYAFPAMRAHLWRDHADAVLEEFTRRHPGRRPSSWWLFDAPGPRLLRWHGRGIESQAAYLRRHNLLGEAEGARLRRGAFRPVRITRKF